jgi:histidine ammonia-lyase
LGKSGNTFDEDVAFGEQAHEQSFDKLLLTDQNLADFAAHAIDKTMLLFDPPGEFLPRYVLSYSGDGKGFIVQKAAWASSVSNREQGQRHRDSADNGDKIKISLFLVKRYTGRGKGIFGLALRRGCRYLNAVGPPAVLKACRRTR